MDFDFSDEYVQLGASARQLLAKSSDLEALKRAPVTGRFDRDLWESVCGLGWLAGPVPSDLGGYEAGLTGPCVVAEELGRACAAVPFPTSVLVLEMLAGSPPSPAREALAERILHGDVVAFSPVPIPLYGEQVSGVVDDVAFGADAGCLVMVASDEAGAPTLVAVSLREADPIPQPTADPSWPIARITLDGVACDILARGEDATAALDRARDRAAVVAAFEMLGGAQQCLELATTYVSGRYQFGRPVGSFQAVKHKLADILVSVELARSLAYGALWAAEEGTAAPLATSLCWLAVGDAHRSAVEEGLHLHGGIGFTWEADPHLYLRRSVTLAGLFGTSTAWTDRAAAHILGDGAS